MIIVWQTFIQTLSLPLHNHKYMSLLANTTFLRTMLLQVLVVTVAGDLCSQNIAVNTTGAAAAAANLFEVTQPAGAANNSVGIFSSHLGTGTNAYAIWAEATGATNKYAIVVPNGGGSVGIGTTTPIGTLNVVGSSPNYIDRISNVSNEGAVFIHRRARGTVAAPAAVQNGDELAKFLVAGYDGSSYLWMGGISAIVNGAVAAGSIPTDLLFGVSSVHMGNPQTNEAMRITNGKRVGIGTTSPDGSLHVASASGTGRQIVVGGPSIYPNGWVDISSNVSGSGLLGGNMYTDWNPSAFKYSESHGTIGAMGFAVNYPFSNWASVITSGTTSSTADASFTPTPIAVFDYTGKVGIGSGLGAIMAKLYVVDATSRQIAARDWLDISSDGGGYGVIGGNVYTNWGDNTFRYAQSHGSIGGIGLATNYPSWNQASIFSSGTTSSTGGNSFTPTNIAVFDYSGKVGIGTNSPATKLDVQGTSGTTLKIVDGNQGAGKVLTSDASGVASWTNGPSAAGSGYIKLLYAEEADESGGGADPTNPIKSYAVPANSYSYIMVEAEVAIRDPTVASGEWEFQLLYAGVTKESGRFRWGNTSALSSFGTLKYSEAMTAGGTVQVNSVKVSTTALTWYVKSFRVYGIY